MKLERGPRAQVHDIFVDIAPLVFGCGVALWQRPATIDPEQAAAAARAPNMSAGPRGWMRSPGGAFRVKGES